MRFSFAHKLEFLFFEKEWKLFRPMIWDFRILFRSEIGKNAIEWIRNETTKINVCYICYLEFLQIQRYQHWTLSFFKLILNWTRTAPITAKFEALPRIEIKDISFCSNKFWLENIHQIRMFSFLKAINFPIFELTMHKQRKSLQKVFVCMAPDKVEVNVKWIAQTSISLNLNIKLTDVR